MQLKGSCDWSPNVLSEALTNKSQPVSVCFCFAKSESDWNTDKDNEQLAGKQ